MGWRWERARAGRTGLVDGRKVFWAECCAGDVTTEPTVAAAMTGMEAGGCKVGGAVGALCSVVCAVGDLVASCYDGLCKRVWCKWKGAERAACTGFCGGWESWACAECPVVGGLGCSIVQRVGNS